MYRNVRWLTLFIMIYGFTNHAYSFDSKEFVKKIQNDREERQDRFRVLFLDRMDTARNEGENILDSLKKTYDICEALPKSKKNNRLAEVEYSKLTEILKQNNTFVESKVTSIHRLLDARKASTDRACDSNTNSPAERFVDCSNKLEKLDNMFWVSEYSDYIKKLNETHNQNVQPLLQCIKEKKPDADSMSLFKSFFNLIKNTNQNNLDSLSETVNQLMSQNATN